MTCETVELKSGVRAILCHSRGRRPIKCAKCGNFGARLCDWKVARQGGGGEPPKAITCDTPLCDSCTYQPAPGKDLCPHHAAVWKQRLASRAANA